MIIVAKTLLRLRNILYSHTTLATSTDHHELAQTPVKSSINSRDNERFASIRRPSLLSRHIAYDRQETNTDKHRQTTITETLPKTT